jgi:osmoprotectant transport system permease protein
MTAADISEPRAQRWSVDRLGVVIFAIAAAGLLTPFILFRANRIVSGEARYLLDVLPGWPGYVLFAIIALAGIAAILRLDARVRLAVSFVALAALAIGLGWAVSGVTPDGDRISRTSPAMGFWLGMLAFGLLGADSVVRLGLRPLARVALLGGIAMALAVILLSGLWSDLSVMREYANRAEAFWREGATHVVLALGSLAVAMLVGLPLGIAIHPTSRLRAAITGLLSAVQTIPSIALFGLLIAPLAWVAANVPGAAAIGIAGIGSTPAMVALFLYSLMPVVANTLAGLDGVPAAANEAARGMGMTDRERLLQVQLPLAFPAILAAIRIVLVQNIGLATVAALIGGGGFGVFVFQGVGQTAMDLVLLGAVPTVALVFALVVVFYAIVEPVSVRDRR